MLFDTLVQFNSPIFYVIFFHSLCLCYVGRELFLRGTSVLHWKVVGWARNHFNDLHFRTSLEAKKTLELGIGKSLMFSQCLKSEAKRRKH